MAKRKKLKKNQKRKLVKMFLRIMGITLVACLLIVGGLAASYKYFIQVDDKDGAQGGLKATKEKDKDKKNKDINTNLAVFGVDKDGYRTDVIFVVNFNSKLNKIKVASLPRDTKVTWTESQKDRLRKDGKYVVNVSKLNEMTSYGGIENIREYTIDQIQNILGIKIDNYVIVDIDGFKQIVDAIGGVDMYVPQRLKYTDRSGGLFIDLQEGDQNLDGEKAEQLVRFRHYPNGDVDRVQVQQIFLKAFADKVLSPTILTKVPKLINILFNAVTTDVSLTEMPQYYTYLNKFDKNNLSFYTLPGVGRYEGGISYYFPDMEAIDEFTNTIFFEQASTTPETIGANLGETKEEAIIEDKTVSLEILNGSGVTGGAATAKDTLETKGYSVSRIGNYESSDVKTTIIYAKDEKKANQFKTYYPKATIRYKSNMDYDIQIVLGKDE